MSYNPENRFKKAERQYTADEVFKAAEAGGVKGSLLDKDIALINSNPNVGMQMINSKIRYMNAPKGEEGDFVRGLEHAYTNDLRNTYGGYAANADGTTVAPSVTTVVAGKPTMAGAAKKASPTNVGNNDLYASYEKALLDAQAKAQKNVYGMVAAGTGGNASSSAVTKAAAAGADYSQLLAEKKAEFENQEYNRAWEEAERAASLGDFSKLKALGINTTQYEIEQMNKKNLEKKQSDLNDALIAMDLGDYSKLAALGIDTSYLEKINADNEAKSNLEIAIQMAKLGIYEPLEKLGYDASWLRSQQSVEDEPKLNLNSALSLMEAGYSSPEIDAALKYWLGEGYTYTAPQTTEDEGNARATKALGGLDAVISAMKKLGKSDGEIYEKIIGIIPEEYNSEEKVKIIADALIRNGIGV